MASRKRTYNTRLLKATLPYSVQDVAELYGLHKNVVRRWFKEGLKRIDDRKPHLVRGDEVARFLNQRQSSRKIKCQPHEFYCLKCRAPRQARDSKVEIVQEGPKLMRVKAVCGVCGTSINKSQALKNLPIIEKTFSVTQRAGFNLSHCPEPRLNVDMENEDA